MPTAKVPSIPWAATTAELAHRDPGGPLRVDLGLHALLAVAVVRKRIRQILRLHSSPAASQRTPDYPKDARTGWTKTESQAPSDGKSSWQPPRARSSCLVVNHGRSTLRVMIQLAMSMPPDTITPAGRDPDRSNNVIILNGFCRNVLSLPRPRFPAALTLLYRRWSRKKPCM